MKIVDLEVGKFYVGGRSKALIRRIDVIMGDYVSFMDCAGRHVIACQTFARWAKEIVPSPTSEHLRQLSAGESVALARRVLIGAPPKEPKPEAPFRSVLYGVVKAEDVARIKASGIPAGTRFYTVPVYASGVMQDMWLEGISGTLIETAFTDELRETAVTSAPFQWKNDQFPSSDDLVWTNVVVLPASLFEFHRPEGDVGELAIDTDALLVLRDFLEPLWQDWQDRNVWRDELISGKASDGLCSMASGFLLRYLDLPISSFKRGQFEVEPEFRRQRNRGEGSTRGHTWISVGGWIIDLTADQFGSSIPKIVVTGEDDARYAEGELRHWYDWGNYQLEQELDEWLDLAKSTAGLPSANRILYGLD